MGAPRPGKTAATPCTWTSTPRGARPMPPRCDPQAQWARAAPPHVPSSGRFPNAADAAWPSPVCGATRGVGAGPSLAAGGVITLVVAPSPPQHRRIEARPQRLARREPQPCRSCGGAHAHPGHARPVPQRCVSNHALRATSSMALCAWATTLAAAPARTVGPCVYPHGARTNMCRCARRGVGIGRPDGCVPCMI